jgi:hypothetical protein
MSSNHANQPCRYLRQKRIFLLRHGSIIALTALMMSIWRGIEAASGKPDLNLSQILSCLAIVNGSDAPQESTEVTCPVEYSQDLGPIRFVEGDEVDTRQSAVGVFARVLKDPAADGLVVRLVGHSDFLGDYGPKRSVSLWRAKNLADALQSEGVPKERLVAQGRSDSEPFGQEQDKYSREKGNGRCKLFDDYVNCDRRVSVEVVSPLVARYGLLAEGRKRSSLIFDERVRYVRYYLNGLVPGQPYSIDLRKLLPKEKDFGLKWHPDCQRVASDWIEVKTTGSLFDKHAGPLWVRARSRENVDSESRSAQTLVLELAATKSAPEHGKETPLPDYWAVRMRMTKMDDKKISHGLLPVFESLRNRILGNQSPPNCTGEGECKTDPKQVERQTAARACLGGLLEESNDINIPLIAQIEGALPQNLAMHGDDRLAQAFGVNAWAPSFSVQPGMEVCIGEATYIYQSGTTDRQAIDNGRLGCTRLVWSGLGNTTSLSFDSWITDMGQMFPSFRDSVSNSRLKGTICGDLDLGTNSGFIDKPEKLGCIASARAVLLFPHVLPEGSSAALSDRHLIATAETAARMQAFMQTIQSPRNANNGLRKICTANSQKGITCVSIGVNQKTPTSTEDTLQEVIPRLRVNLIGSNSVSSVKPIPLGARLAYLIRHRPSAVSNEAWEKDPVKKQLHLEFGSDSVVEQSTQLLDQWPVTTLEAHR